MLYEVITYLTFWRFPGFEMHRLIFFHSLPCKAILDLDPPVAGLIFPFTSGEIFRFSTKNRRSQGLRFGKHKNAPVNGDAVQEVAAPFYFP